MRDEVRDEDDGDGLRDDGEQQHAVNAEDMGEREDKDQRQRNRDHRGKNTRQVIHVAVEAVNVEMRDAIQQRQDGHHAVGPSHLRDAEKGGDGCGKQQQHRAAKRGAQQLEPL
ncbi:hypothetical protein GALL_463920 [mine drainage metagenome]|uniref:Uncharacterized protein n=1 Tax=mine drainage metagenome TaxID=410659 RepID=A0A1J5PLF2_9ZZZZ